MKTAPVPSVSLRETEIPFVLIPSTYSECLPLALGEIIGFVSYANANIFTVLM